MPKLTILLTGVCAYVPEERQLSVFLPNAARLGSSPQRPLPAHRPFIWQLGRRPGDLYQIERWRSFLWSRLHLNIEGGSPDPPELGELETAGGPAEQRLQLSTALAGHAPWTAGKVVLTKGRVSGVASSSCKTEGWCAYPDHHTCQAPTQPDEIFPASSVVNHVKLTVENVSRVDVTFSTLLTVAAPLPTPTSFPMQEDTWIGIGNVCAENLLQWQPNDAKHYADRDFQWIYELVDAADKPMGCEYVPVIDQLRTPFDTSEDPLTVLQDLYGGGGGGMGCECNGIIAAMKA